MHAETGERVRILRAWQGRNPDRPTDWTIEAQPLDSRALFPAPDAAPGAFLATPEWIVSRYRSADGP